MSCYALNGLSWKDRVRDLFPFDKPAKAKSDQNLRMAAAIERAVKEEKAIANEALSNWGRRYPVSVIGGGL